MKKETKEKKPSLEDRLLSLTKIYNEPCVATVFIEPSGKIIIGRIIGQSAVKYEEQFTSDGDEEDNELQHEQKINPMTGSELWVNYIG